jgi:hypothetical protein
MGAAACFACSAWWPDRDYRLLLGDTDLRAISAAAGTDVSVDVDINSVPAGAGIFGQEDRHVEFHVGSANIYKVNAQTHQMQVFSNGKLLRTIPVTTGKAAGITGVIVQLGPFGGAQAGGERLFQWVVIYLAALAVVALVGFARKDL